VHIELSTVYQNDNGAVMVIEDPPMKYPASEDDYDSFGAALKPQNDIEASPRELPPLPIEERNNARVHEDSVRRQQQLLAREREREEFQKRI
jgi:hypothetical protein